jgi:hypothetical protein
MSVQGQQRRSKAARTLVRSTPKRRHADRQRILRIGAIFGTSMGAAIVASARGCHGVVGPRTYCDQPKDQSVTLT